MEYTSEVRLDLDSQFKLFAVKTSNTGLNNGQCEQETNFDLNVLVFVESQEFEVEALQLYTDLLIQKLPESRTNTKLISLSNESERKIDFEFFLAKKLVNNEELYIFSSNDETNYNTKIGIIHQIMKKTKDSFDMGHQKLFDNDESMEVCESPSSSSPCRRRLKIKSTTTEI